MFPPPAPTPPPPHTPPRTIRPRRPLALNRFQYFRGSWVVGSNWGRCGARGPRGQGQDGFLVVFFLFSFRVLCASAFLPSTANPTALTLARSLIGSDIIFISRLCCGWLLGEGWGEGQGAGAGRCGACGVLFYCFVSFRLRELGVLASCICCAFSHAPPCCRNPIHVK